jgi:hypothetical protein
MIHILELGDGHRFKPAGAGFKNGDLKLDFAELFLILLLLFLLVLLFKLFQVVLLFLQALLNDFSPGNNTLFHFFHDLVLDFVGN